MYDVLDASDWNQFVRTEYSQWSDDGSMYTPIGETITFTDQLGRTARIEDTLEGDATKTVEFAYDDTNRVVDVARKAAGGFFFDTTYDNAGRVTGINHYRNGDTIPFTKYLYGYDQADRITAQVTDPD